MTRPEPVVSPKWLPPLLRLAEAACVVATALAVYAVNRCMEWG